MNRNSSSFDKVVLSLLILFTVFVCALLAWSKLRPRESRPAQDLPVISQIAAFTLTNQFERPVTLADLRGNVWIGDIIFTRCTGPCPKMTRSMSELQAALPANSPVKLVTLTTDPEFDRPEVLKAYGQKYGADFGRWSFLTGAKLEIARVAADGLKLTALERKPEERTAADDLFIHSTRFVVVDKQGRLRGSFETTGEGVNPEEAKRKVLAAAEMLAREN